MQNSRTPQSYSGAGRSCRQSARPSDLSSTDGWKSCDTASTTASLSDLDVVIATSHGAAISARQGLMPGRYVLQRNCVPHAACVSCPSVAAPQCDCSIASMIVHGTPISRHLTCESRQTQLANKDETLVCCNVDWGGSRIVRIDRETGHESPLSHHCTPSLAARHWPQMATWMFTGSRHTPPPHYPYQYDKKCDPSSRLSTMSAMLGSFDALAEIIGPILIAQSRQ